MKTLFLTLLITLSLATMQAEITKVNSMDEVFSYLAEADAKTLAVFDVDMVIVQSQDPAFQMANMKRYSAIAKRIMQEVPEDKQMLFLSLMTLSCEAELIDARFPQLLKGLAQKGISSMALTANLTGELNWVKSMEKWRVDTLKGIEVDFSCSAPFKESIVFDHLAAYRGNFSTFRDGILFVNGKKVSKGEVFLSFLEKANFQPTKVIFIDDREDNLKSLEIVLALKGIEYVGLHFLGAQYYPSKMVSAEEFEAKWLKLATLAKEYN